MAHVKQEAMLLSANSMRLTDESEAHIMDLKL